MKALTVCQPYAALLIPTAVQMSLPPASRKPPRKRVENRRWKTAYRGPLAIHAGKSLRWLDLYRPYADDPEWCDLQRDRSSGLDLDDMAFGAVVGVVDVIDCLPVAEILSGACDEQYPWIRAHKHVHGPYCFVFDNARPLSKWLPYRGAQGFFDVSDELLTPLLPEAK